LEKYCQTLRSIDTGRKTFALGGIWWRPRTPWLKSTSDNMDEIYQAVSESGWIENLAGV
jgi:hypothetical protein